MTTVRRTLIIAAGWTLCGLLLGLLGAGAKLSRSRWLNALGEAYTTLIRGVLLPAGIRLLGERAWWAPAPLKALHRRIGLSESATDPSKVPEPVG